ncbi:hypothetical protein [Streptomyces sp. NPDC051286]|uniref:hypothetical protein n=1 Tax=Streptomyces sp. NPDC051286 TaxID=3365647 RepID=UPI003798C9C2
MNRTAAGEESTQPDTALMGLTPSVGHVHGDAIRPRPRGTGWANTGLSELLSDLRFVHWAEPEFRAPQADAALRAQLTRHESLVRGCNIAYDQ